MGKSMSTISTFHKILTGISFISVLAGFVMSIVYASQVLTFGKCDGVSCQSMLFITTTFMKLNRIETSIGWPVATERALSNDVFFPFNQADTTKDRSYRFGHYLECMHTARMVDKTCSPDLTFADYARCLTNRTAVVQALDQCASFPTVGSYFHWPTPEEYLTCLWNNPLLQNSESRRASQNVFRACVERTLWPFFEVPQGIDTPVFMGSFNWGILLVAGFVVMTSFGVYQAGWKEDGAFNKGETEKLWMRLGLVWSGAAFLWNVVFFSVFLAVAFRGSGELMNNGGLPTTSTTTFVTFLVLGAAVLYFFFIVFSHPRRTGRYMAQAVHGKLAKIVPMPEGVSLHDSESRGRLLGATFPRGDKDKYELSGEEVTKYYTPPLLATWADSYFADFCIVLGMAGATGQLSTDRAWNLFTLTLVYRILNMIISRCISDAFMNNLRLSEAINTATRKIFPNTSYGNAGGEKLLASAEEGVVSPYHLNIQVIGLTTQLAAFYLYLALLIMAFDGNFALSDFTLFRSFIIVCFIIPEALRLVIHVFLQMFYNVRENAGGVPWLIYNSFFLIWIWDYVARLIFIGVALYGSADVPGTFEFLKTQTNSMMGTYVSAMTA